MELAWEIGDFIHRFHDRLFTKNGAQKQPFNMLLAMICHHVGSFSLCLPFNLFISDTSIYFEMFMNLQIAAGSVLGLQSYSQTLNAESDEGIKTMYYHNAFMGSFLIFTRFAWFPYISYRLIAHFEKHGFVYFYYMYWVACVGMMVFNIAMTKFFVYRFFKFSKLYSESLKKKAGKNE